MSKNSTSNEHTVWDFATYVAGFCLILLTIYALIAATQYWSSLSPYLLSPGGYLQILDNGELINLTGAYINLVLSVVLVLIYAKIAKFEGLQTKISQQQTELQRVEYTPRPRKVKEISNHSQGIKITLANIGDGAAVNLRIQPIVRFADKHSLNQDWSRFKSQDLTLDSRPSGGSHLSEVGVLPTDDHHYDYLLTNAEITTTDGTSLNSIFSKKMAEEEVAIIQLLLEYQNSLDEIQMTPIETRVHTTVPDPDLKSILLGGTELSGISRIDQKKPVKKVIDEQVPLHEEITSIC